MIKFIILGFLTHGQFTGYDLKRMMTYSTSNFVSASFGSIYPALSRLEKDGLISSTKVIENGRYKKQYTINKIGEQEFLRWLEEPIDFMRSYEDILAKVFFYEKLPKESSIKLIEQLIKDINTKIEEIEKLETIIRKGAGDFEMSTFYFGRDHLKFMADWYGRFIDGLKKGQVH